MSFFEVLTGMAYAAFADAPVDAAVVEVGMGGVWDATNVADGQVAVVTPVAVDHTAYLGDDPVGIATEKAGIIKAGAMAVLAQQPDEVTEVLQRRAAEVGATVALEGVEFGVGDRVPGVGGQVVTLRGLAREYDEIFLPLHGAHQAHNAACAVAAVEAFLGGNELDPDVVREAFAAVASPGRLEVARRSPTILLDGAHNPHGAEATAEALQEAFSFSPAGRRGRGDGRQGRGGPAGGLRAGPRRDRVHAELDPARDAGRTTSATSPRASSAPTGCTSRRGSTTPSTWRPGWRRAARRLRRVAGLRRSAGHRLGRDRRARPARCWGSPPG